jgi:hypothetical protein
MANQPKDQQINDQEVADKDEYDTPIDESQRHTVVHEKSDRKKDDQPKGGINAGPEGAPNQGTEKR